ncbi:MAG: hypothetical protein A3G59_01090 [Candidatus Taylorbacteria bacterium RIFCSPLOWO2_12_FULL_47_20]|uniref:RNHCP domain-containing protein n=2 Tax=Candidatus Tayloriibacteriota TaxID=1817919 RepID=A0A1G2P8R3_9BACT|nr:MAG: hypothetical protein A3H68_00390 [Candidatus Taylorbacteria bacterium RIFCSPLOWO2_02_FULL_46_40]OHA44746.1 MAG: hypothetical protein A3G59_01090 [Candidatus Taylorbacteria bacterium RIFCSPLOWO2_12_FULL_47_20]
MPRKFGCGTAKSNPNCKVQQELDDLLKSQRGYICAQTGHTNHIALPVQKDDETRKVLCRCVTCGRERWVELPEEGYRDFLADLAVGKIKYK